MKLASDFYWYLNCEKEDDYMLKEYQKHYKEDKKNKNVEQIQNLYGIIKNKFMEVLKK